MTEGIAKRMIIVLGVAALLAGGVVWFQSFKTSTIADAIKAHSNPPQAVSTTVAQELSWQPDVEALGSLSASQQASLSSEVGGLVTAIRFDSGQKVQAGEPLVELNASPLEAQLAQLQSQAALAQINLERDRAQLDLHAVSQAVVDTDAATLESARALVAAQRALIAQKRIVAPFSGQLGLRRVNLGQFLAPGAAVVTLQKLDPMDVDFTVPQSRIHLIHIGMKAQVVTSAARGKTFEGKVIAIEPQVAAVTRNLTVRARVRNATGELLPGVFATVRIGDGPPRNYVTLPNAAVAYHPYGATVYVVRDDGKGPDGRPRLVAEQRFITTGPTRGDQVAALQGVKAGETVVTAGQIKLRNGTPVRVNNSVTPADSPNPQVPDS